MANIVEIILKGQDRTGSAFKSAIQNLTGMNMAQLTVAAGAASLAVAVGAAFTSLVAHSIEAADQMGVMAQRAGEGVETFSRLAYAAQQADVSQEDLTRASRAWAENAGKMKHGNESFADSLLRIADEFENTADSGAKLRIAYDNFGKSGQNLIPLLNQGGQALRDAAEEADLFNITISQGFQKNADKFLDNIDRLKGAVRGLGNTIAEGVLPSMIKFTDSLIDSAKEVVKLSKAMEKVPEWVFWLSPVTAALRLQALAWKQLRGEKEAAEGDPEKAPIVDPEDMRKAEEMFQKLNDSRKRGASEVIAEERRLFESQMKNIGELQITEEKAAQLRAEAEQAHIDRLRELYTQYTQFRAEQEHNLAEGNVQAFISEMNSKRGQMAAWLDSQREIAQVYQGLWQKSFFNIGNAIREFAATALQTFSEGFGNAVAAIATGAMTAKEAFSQLGNQMLGMLVKFAAQLVINSLLAAVLQTTLAASAVAAMTPVLAINTAAATGAAIATLGGATSAAAGVPIAMAANVAAAQVISGFGGVAHGGLDYVPAESTYLLNRGEKVLYPRQGQRLDAMLDDWERGGRSGGGPVHIHLHVANHEIAEWLWDGTRDGSITIHQRAVVA